MPLLAEVGDGPAVEVAEVLGVLLGRGLLALEDPDLVGQLDVLGAELVGLVLGLGRASR